MNNLLCHHIYIFMFRRICKNARIWYLYCAFLSMHWTFLESNLLSFQESSLIFKTVGIYIWKRESLSYLISWNVCYVDIVVFMRLKVHNKINTAGAKSHKYFAAFFWVQKWTFTCFCFFFLSTNLTNVTICGKLYEFY